MRLFPRRDHPSRRLLRFLERRIVAACGLKRAWSRRSRVSLAPRRTDGGTPPLLLIVSGEPGTPGHEYRVVRFAAAAADLGWQVQVLDVADLPVETAAIAKGRPAAVLIWRATWRPALEEAVTGWRGHGARIVFDVDDHMMDPAIADVSVIDGIRSQRLRPADIAAHYAAIRRTLLLADECLAPTEPLAVSLRDCGRPTTVVPNCFGTDTYRASREAVARRRREPGDGLVRIGYASGSPTHQRDFAVAAPGVAAVLRARPACRLVLFHDARRRVPMLDVREFPALHGLEDRIEWRRVVPLDRLPDELARFDVNLAPLEVGNVFCEAKSQLKYFEAALVETPTIASPTRPYRDAIVDGETGLLAATAEEWHHALLDLVDAPDRRRSMGRAALHHVLHRHGPDGLRERVRGLLDRIARATATPTSFTVSSRGCTGLPVVPDTTCVERHGGARLAEVAVVIPLHNYAGLVTETLDSVARQTFSSLELVVVDDCSNDESLAVARRWIHDHAGRFVTATLLQTAVNQGLALTRNAGFAATEAPFVFPLDADNTLEPDCLRLLVEELRHSPASAAHPTLRHFGESSKVKPARAWDPARLRRGNYIDAMALVRKSAWAHAGGYVKGAFVGWEDYELWCRFVEHGFWSAAVPEAVAGYRVHRGSMLRSVTESDMQRVVDAIRAAHPWLTVRAA